ncbi:MAG: hypothetical protein KIT84_20660 [Labilithrix sp.]|nr:hypothetical protein [Labilithrix sp.]MCW5813453.1 hypothetical protein [Labilithrix sp.]
MRRVLLFMLALAAGPACDGASAVTPPPEAPPCDDECKDEIAVRAVRETVKLAFNLTFQGKPVGEYDLAAKCPQGGAVRVTGSATSNAIQGATEVRIVYQLEECAYLSKDEDADENYETKITGVFTQEGVMAVQPTSPTALIMASPSLKIEGSVYDPPSPYNVECPLQLGQTGNALSGKICGRNVETDL